jgi:nicotinate-nucleotide pyrophosphorylase (carboxylating)
VARSSLVVAGIPVAEAVFQKLDPEAGFQDRAAEGAELSRGSCLLSIRADIRALLEGERTALNFVQRMSGIAFATKSAVREIAGTGAIILDTRKTVPGLRALDKYAVAVGGGFNHRMGLYDGAMIKDTHRVAIASTEAAVQAIVESGVSRDRITVEVRNLSGLREALRAGAGRVLLDNMGTDEIRACVAEGKGRAILEVSGGLRPGGLREIAELGVDCLSVGWLTHSAPASDVAMEMMEYD